MNEQRDLTKAISIQGSRARAHSQNTEEHTRFLNTHKHRIHRHSDTNTLSIPCRPPVATENEDERQEEQLAVHRKWTHLHNRLTEREETQQGEDKEQDPAEV